MYLKKRLIVAFLVFAIIPALIIAIISLFIAQDTLRKTRIDQLESIADLKVDKINTFFNERTADLESVQHINAVRKYFALNGKTQNGEENNESDTVFNELNYELSAFRKAHGYAGIFLLNEKGKIVYIVSDRQSSSKIGEPLPDPGGKAFYYGRKGNYFTSIYIDKSDNDHLCMLGAAPIIDTTDSFMGLLVLEIDMGPLYRLIQDRTGLGRTGETLIGKTENEEAVFLNPLRHEPDAAFKKRMPLSMKNPIPLVEAVQKHSGSGIKKDYRGVEVIAAWRYIPALQWGLVAKIDTKEAFESVTHLRNLVMLFTGILLLVSSMLAVAISRTITKPIHELHQGTEIIGSGHLNHKVATQKKDEIGQLLRAFDTMTENLKRITASRDELNKEIEERKRFEERVKMQTLALEAAATAMVITDKDGIIIWANPAFTTLTGYTVEEAIGQNPRILKSEKHDASFYEDMWKTISSGKIWHKELINRHKNGTCYPEEMTITPVFDSNGIITNYIAIKQDISKRKEVENMKSRFISMVSHELRTPLTSILGSLGLIKGGVVGELPSQAQQLLEIALRNSERLLNLINDILDIEKMEAGKMRFIFQPLDIKSLVEKCIEAMRSYAENYQVRFRIKETVNDSPMVNADPDRLIQVLSNLLSNAAKFSPTQSFVEISIERKDTYVYVLVTDHGPGIPEKFRPMIFEKFAQADSSDSRTKSGTGLGLSISKAIMDALHGVIGYTSEEGKGTTFYFGLPEWHGKAVDEGIPVDIKIDGADNNKKNSFALHETEQKEIIKNEQ